MARLPCTRKRQDAKPRAARCENEGRQVPCANCKGEFVRRRRDQTYCRRPECCREIQRRAHARWYGRHGVEQRAKMRQRYAADPTKVKGRQMIMYQRKKAAAEDEAGASFAASLAAVYMTVGSGERGAAAGGGGAPGGQAARKAGRPRASPLRRSLKSHGPAGRAGETPQRTCGSWHERVAYAGPQAVARLRRRPARPWRLGRLGVHGRRPAGAPTRQQTPAAGPARGASATGSGTRAADPSLPIDAGAAKPVWAGSAAACPRVL